MFFFTESLLSETDMQYCSWRNTKFYLEPRSRGESYCSSNQDFHFECGHNLQTTNKSLLVHISAWHGWLHCFSGIGFSWLKLIHVVDNSTFQAHFCLVIYVSQFLSYTSNFSGRANYNIWIKTFCYKSMRKHYRRSENDVC